MALSSVAQAAIDDEAPTPAPVPQMALGVSLFMMFSTAYRAWLGEQLKVAGREGPKDVWQFCAAFSVIFGVPNLFSQYHLATSPWQGAPIKRGNDDNRHASCEPPLAPQ